MFDCTKRVLCLLIVVLMTFTAFGCAGMADMLGDADYDGKAHSDADKKSVEAGNHKAEPAEASQATGFMPENTPAHTDNADESPMPEPENTPAHTDNADESPTPNANTTSETPREETPGETPVPAHQGEDPATHKPDADNTPEPAPEHTPAPADKPEHETNVRVLTQSLFVSVEKTTLYPGDVTRAHCQVYPSGASNDVKWTTSNERLVRISGDGVIRIHSTVHIQDGGEYVDIWAKAKDGSLVMALETIHILPKVSRVKLYIGDTTVYSQDDAPFLSVFVDIQPVSLFGNTRIIWQSSDPEVAIVTPGGVMGEAAMIIWRNPGQTVITAKSEANPDCFDCMTLSVLPPII